MNSWPSSEATRATVKFWGQSFSRGHSPPIYQPAGNEFIYFIILRIITRGELTYIVPTIASKLQRQHLNLARVQNASEMYFTFDFFLRIERRWVLLVSGVEGMLENKNKEHEWYSWTERPTERPWAEKITVTIEIRIYRLFRLCRLFRVRSKTNHPQQYNQRKAHLNSVYKVYCQSMH